MTEKELFEKYSDSEPCSCLACVHMCETRPCWPTPEESGKIMDAGFADRLMADYWVETDAADTVVISPAIKGFEGHDAPFVPHGGCTFLDKNGLCELHDLGLKPVEGRVAHCKGEGETSGLHEAVADLWREDSPKTEKQWED